MGMHAGTKLGPYEIQSPLGAGGMGEVYRARDTRLDRTVAIKILPAHLSDSPEAKQRFDREARAISSLSHSNICTLYDVGHQDGTDFLVMEYLEGETLAERLQKGPLPPDQVLKYGIEVCEGLEKAHHSGVIHRDLKPGNIMLTKGGAKLLDFGLAKAALPARSLDLTSPTVNQPAARPSGGPLTARGTIVGTFQYMSPEQLEGKDADARSDIFSLGTVLYEMTTGKKPFEGKSQASLIAAILEHEPPPISQLQPMTPLAVERLVKTCLAKDPEERLQTVHDLKLQLEWIRDAGSQAEVPTPALARRKRRERITWAAMAVLAIALGLAIAGYVERAPQPATTIVAEISPPANTNFVMGGDVAGIPVISPDGKNLAFAAMDKDGRQRLWVRALNSATARPVEETDEAMYPFWSPDSRSIGFFANGKLNWIGASGGPPMAIADVSAARGGSWSPRGTILFTPNTASPIYRVPAAGGTPQPVTKLNASRQEITHRWPQFLPDGKHFLFYAHGNVAENNATYAASLEGGEPKLLIHGDSNAIYAPPGYLLFVRQGTLMVQRFDGRSLSLIGDAEPLAEHAEVNLVVWRGIFTVSENGVLAYEVGTASAGFYRLLWFDRSGKQIAETGTPGSYYDPRISPDGGKLAITMADPGNGSNYNIWIFDLARGVNRRLTFSSSIDREPAWSPDGNTIAFQSNRGGLVHLYRNAADGTGSASALVVDNAAEYVPSFSSDGHYLIYQRQATQPDSHNEIWAMPLVGERKPFPVAQNQQFDVTHPALSPDGKWLAYDSLGTGRPEVYVVPFGQGSGKWEVSTAGGRWPRWRGDGKELFYLSPNNKIMSAQISEQGSSITVDKVSALFPVNATSSSGWFYDVSASGKKFVVVSRGVQQTTAPLTLVANWPKLLKGRQ